MLNLVKIYRKIDAAILRFEETFVGTTLIFISVMAFINVIMRYFFGDNLNWVEELARYLVVWITFIGGSLCVRSGEHVVMSMLLDRVAAEYKKILRLAINFLGAVVVLYLAYLGALYSLNTFQSGQISPILNVSMGWAYLGIPVGCVLMAKNFMEIFIREITEGGLTK